MRARRFLALAAVLCLYRWPLDLELALVALGAFALGLPRDERLPAWAERAGFLALLLLLLGRAHSPVALEVARGRGKAVAFAYVGVLAVETFFVAARAVSPRATPGTWAAVLATVLAALAAYDGALWVKKKDRPNAYEDVQDLVHAGASPLVALAPPRENDYRGRPFAVSKEPGTWRVLLLGGSSAWGHAQPDRATSPTGRLEERLRRELAPRKVEVLCLACPGFTSDQELALVASAALGWEPDLLLAIDGYNDLGYLSGKDAYPGDMYVWPQHRSGFSHPLRRFLLLHSPLPRGLVAAGATLPQWAQDRLEPGQGNGFFLDGLVANEESLAILARDAGVPFAWSAAPLSFDRAEPGPDAKHVRAGAAGEEMHRRSAAFRERATRAVTARKGVALDLPSRLGRRSVAAKDEAWFVDECHYTDRGVETLADETVLALREASLLPR
jgi:hypothetical protein